MSPFLLSETPSVSTEIARLGVPKRYAPGEFVYRQGVATAYFHQVLTGRVRIFIALPDGSERVLSYAEPEASFGEAGCFDGLPRYASSIAVEPSEVLCIGRDDIVRAAATNPAIMLEMARRLAHKQRVLGLHIASDGLPARVRVALLLLHLTEAYGESLGRDQVRLLVRHRIDDLALIIGVTRVTMSRELSRLIAEGIVTKAGRDIHIERLQVLEAMVTEHVALGAAGTPAARMYRV